MKTTDELNLTEFYPKDLEIISVENLETEIWIHMKSCSKTFNCPKCGTELNKYHSMHHRRVQDLPILGKRTMLDINMHDYYCTNDDCDVGSIVETYDGFLDYCSRNTERLIDFAIILALETSCESAARILKASNIKISGDTIIRMLMRRYSEQEKPVCGNAIGIDDFAFKKRHTYGTVIVDEGTHKTVAVLNGRDGETLKKWLKQNQHVKTVTRDRASAYAKAVEEVLPDCMQIADRFHLHQNLLEAVKRVVNGTVPVDIKIPSDYGKTQETEQHSQANVCDGKKNL
ncbi:MAG: transposase [Lachnospiraceae bacterium]|nr:transposase [Lachnospiraceae bacterium]